MLGNFQKIQNQILDQGGLVPACLFLGLRFGRRGQRIGNQNGMSLPAIMLAVGFIGMVSVALINFNKQKGNLSRQLNVAVVANRIRYNLVGLVLSPQSWQATQNANQQAFAYLSTGGEPPKLNLYQAGTGTAPYYSSTDPTSGFDMFGNPCVSPNLFDPQLGNDLCPFHYDVTLVSRVYQNHNWLETVHFALSYKPQTSGQSLNTSAPQYSFDLVRNFNSQSVEQSCISVNGNYNSATASCTVSITQDTSCGTGGAFVGPSASSSSGTCGRLALAQSCASGTVLKGFGSDGTPICGPPI